MQLDGRVLEGGLVITIDEDGTLSHVGTEPARRHPEVVLVRRRVPPQLRHWAAERATRRRLLPSDEVRALLTELPSRDRGAGTLGVLDAYETLPPGERSGVLEPALTHGHGRVRTVALRLLAEAGQVQRAEALAAGDRDAGVQATFLQRRAAPDTLF